MLKFMTFSYNIILFLEVISLIEALISETMISYLSLSRCSTACWFDFKVDCFDKQLDMLLWCFDNRDALCKAIV